MQRVLCYLLSHVNGSLLINLKLCILRSVDEISDLVKAQTLLSALTALTDHKQSEEMARRFGEREFEEFETLVVRSLDVATVGELNGDDSRMWGILVGLVKRYMRPGESYSNTRFSSSSLTLSCRITRFTAGGSVTLPRAWCLQGS